MNDPQQYKGEPGAIPLKSTNLAPSVGERVLGWVPYGLTAVLAKNMAGKSRILAALSAIPLPRLQAGLVTKTDGTGGVAISLGSAELRILDGHKAKHINVHAEGPIIELPDPVETMITGGDFKDPDARARARLKALNDFCPVEVTEARLVALCGDAGAPLVESIGEAVTTMLDAADKLAAPRGYFHSQAREMEALASSHGGAAERARGAVDLAVSQTMAAIGSNPDTVGLADVVRQQAIEAAPHRAALEAELLERRQAAQSLGYERRARVEQEQRLTALRAAHGERPDIDRWRAEGDAAQAEEHAAAEQVGKLEQQLAAARERLVAARSRLTRTTVAATDAAEDLRRWQAVEAEIQKPVAGPEQATVDHADQLLLDTTHKLKLARGGSDLLAAIAAKDAATEASETADAEAKRLRGEAARVWIRLGEVMTEAIGSDFVRVNAGALEVRTEDGKWIDVENDERLSKGRLRRAMLEYFLERCDMGINVVVSDEVMLPIDPEGRRLISAKATAKRCRLLFEQPAENEEPELQWYGDGLVAL